MICVNDHKRNFYSQGGEDGIVEFLYDYISPTGFVIEFGAADGTFFSNTAHRWMDLQDTDALLIEGDSERYANLESLARSYHRVVTENSYVYNIDDHTTRVADVCSIDVDGDDYHIVERMQTPHQIVIVEHNPTAPPHVEMIGVEGTMYGSSARSLELLMNHKGYTLVAATKTNLIFLYGDHRDKFETQLDRLFDHGALNYVVTSYDGLYDMIGEWGYGFERPADLRLKGRNTDTTRTYDSTIQEYMRQMIAITDGKESK